MARKKQTGRLLQDRHDEGLAKAIASKKTLTALANCLGLTVQAIAQWKRIPPERCLEVERETGVPRHELRPDVYGEAPERAA